MQNAKITWGTSGSESVMITVSLIPRGLSSLPLALVKIADRYADYKVSIDNEHKRTQSVMLFRMNDPGPARRHGHA